MAHKVLSDMPAVEYIETDSKYLHKMHQEVEIYVILK